MAVLVNKEQDIDVLFIIEGAYPYIKGGVSTCVQQLILGMPETKFGVLFLGSREEDYQGIQYVLPENLVYCQSTFLFSPSTKGKSPRDKHVVNERAFRILQELVYHPRTFTPWRELADPDFYHTQATFPEFLWGKKAWRFFYLEIYQKAGSTIPFVDFFWNLRNIFFPLWHLAEVVRRFPKRFRILHSHSTGYAGLLGSFLKQTTNAPFVLTEHGIYVRERKAEIFSLPWIGTKREENKYEIDTLKRLWINFFTNLGNLAYHSADRIFALYEGARKIQNSLGAPPSKTAVIPNGIEVSFFKPLRRPWEQKSPPAVAFVGRVVPIKDVKTFIKGFKILLSRIPHALGWIVGPENEDPIYAEECRQMVRILQLEGRIQFLGFQKLEDIFPQVALLALTSISEGMPMVVLEALAAGIPCVATDVGSCRQLIYGGLNEEDEQLGEAGRIIKVGDTQGFAEACAEILSNGATWTKMQQTAIERVEKFYTIEQMVKRYQNVYHDFGDAYGWSIL